ncbi:uncharacterized protein LOC118735115 isoform X3 [Rhagoletis pomonella]|uniref:uncharacterized protein LOC118735115 isoform X3 n=1 Tax=Rhagoletis pomonella TaxID=28610 RepID=UPI0017815350|nr:uncharacterized protein LOC118735115 isoform X3 [Rhagoletis pomonella]
MEFSFIIDGEEEPDISQANAGVSRRFDVSQPFLDRMTTQPAVDNDSAQQQILAALARMETRQEEILKRLSAVENALAEKVLSAKTHRSVSRITGDLVSEEQTLLQSLLPMSSEGTLHKVEEHLQNKAHADAMVGIIMQLKTSRGTVEKVLQSLFSDELVWLYNFDGKAGKKPLIKLKTVELVLGKCCDI